MEDKQDAGQARGHRRCWSSDHLDGSYEAPSFVLRWHEIARGGVVGTWTQDEQAQALSLATKGPPVSLWVVCVVHEGERRLLF